MSLVSSPVAPYPGPTSSASASPAASPDFRPLPGSSPESRATAASFEGIVVSLNDAPPASAFPPPPAVPRFSLDTSNGKAWAAPSESPRAGWLSRKAAACPLWLLKLLIVFVLLLIVMVVIVILYTSHAGVWAESSDAQSSDASIPLSQQASSSSAFSGSSLFGSSAQPSASALSSSAAASNHKKAASSSSSSASSSASTPKAQSSSATRRAASSSSSAKKAASSSSSANKAASSSAKPAASSSSTVRVAAAQSASVTSSAALLGPNLPAMKTITQCVPPSNLAATVSGVAASCGVPYNNTACPLPPWSATWNLTLSTTFYGFTPAAMVLPAPNKPWGLIPLDHEVAELLYGTANMMQANAQATLINNCRLIKSTSPHTKCFVYHNTEVALQYFESDRAAMYDPAAAYYFLQNSSGVIYNDGQYGTQFFWDWRNLSATEYIIRSVVNITLSPYVDGIYSDDVNGLPNEHADVQSALNMTDAQVAVNAYCAQTGWLQQLENLIVNGKYDWAGLSDAQGDGIGGAVTASNCNSFISQRCNAASQQTTMTQTFDWYNANQSIAAFLIARPPIAFIGWGFPSSINNWHPSFLYNVGEPLGICYSPAPNVYMRAWTYGNVTMNCSSFTATIPTGPAYVLPISTTPPTVWTLPLLSNVSETLTGLTANYGLVSGGGINIAQPAFSSTSGRGQAWDNAGLLLLPYQIGFLNTSYSQAFWINFSGSFSGQVCTTFVAGGEFGDGEFGGAENGFAGGFVTYLTPSYELAFMHGPGFSPLASVQLPEAAVVNSWMHVAVTFDESSGTARLYVNGSLRNSTSGNQQWTGTGQIVLGYMDGLSWPMDASMQQFQWANYALTAAQVEALYTAS